MTVLNASPRKKQELRTHELMKNCGVFWAFSSTQFAENKTPLPEGDKYISIGGGGYLPKSNWGRLSDGMKEIDKEYRLEIKANREIMEKEILYALNNYECFYTGNTEDVVSEFAGTFTKKQVLSVFNKHIASQEVG